MARPTIQYALLTLLARQEATGQELQRRMRRPVSFFWTAPHSQIYPQLAILTADGLVSWVPDSGGERRPHKRYRITASGLAALTAWMAGAVTPRPPRDELLLRAYGAPMVAPEVAAEVFRAALDRYRSELDVLQGEADAIRAGAGGGVTEPGNPSFGNWIVVQAGIGLARERERWCTWVLSLLEGGGTTA